MKKLFKKEAIKKWKPIVNNFNFDEKYIEKICGYAEYHTLIESINSIHPNQAYNNDNLMLSILTLSKINDLSKVHFVQAPNFVVKYDGKESIKMIQTFQISMNINREEIINLKPTDNLSDVFKEKLSQKIAEHLNESIDKGNHIYIYLVVSSIRLVVEGVDSPKFSAFLRYYCDLNELTIYDL